MRTTRKLKLRGMYKKPAAERQNKGENTAGGFSAPAGYTSDLQATLVQKNIFGLFGDIDPNKTIVQGDIMGTWPSQIVEPVFAFKDLLRIYLQSTILRQCVQAYRVNIDGYGHSLEYIGPDGQQDSLAASNEYARLNRVIDNLTTDGRCLQEHRENARDDLEILGGWAFEIAQDLIGRVVLFNHVQTHTLRMTRRDKDYVPYDAINPLTGSTYTSRRRFRRFLQVLEGGTQVWFKEYGDPRSIDPKTGQVNNNLAIEDQATSIYYQGLYTPGTPYGTPRWAGTIPALLGAREAEMVNLNFFRDNAIPALAVLVSGGSLTDESFNKIEQYIAGVRGQKSMNRIVVLEASASETDMLSTDGSLPAPKVDIKPMLSERQHEGLFANYISATDGKVLSSFRLPPVYVGSAKEYNRASAFASMMVADQQIFIPERMAWDNMFQTVVLATHNPKYWRYRSEGPTLSDPTEVAKIVDTLAAQGAMTPNIAIKLANRYLDADITPVLDEWGDLPFTAILQMIKVGTVIPGFDIFTEGVSSIATTTPPAVNGNADATDPAAAKKIVAKMVHDLFDELSEDLRGRTPLLIADHRIIDYNDQAA